MQQKNAKSLSGHFRIYSVLFYDIVIIMDSVSGPVPDTGKGGPMKRKDSIKLYRSLVLIVLASVMSGLILFSVQKHIDKTDFEDCSEAFLVDVKDSMQQHSATLKQIEAFSNMIREFLNWNMTYTLQKFDYARLTGEERTEVNTLLRNSAKEYGLEELYIMDGHGTVAASADSRMAGQNLIEAGYLTADDLENISDYGRLGTLKADLDENGGLLFESNPVIHYREGTGNIAYYCAFIAGSGDEDYYVVCGDVDVINRTVFKNFGDLSVYFECIVGYDSFCAFAVNMNTDTVEYASNGLLEIKGKSAAEAGIPMDEKFFDGKVHTAELAGRKRRIRMTSYSSDVFGTYVIGAATIPGDRRMLFPVIGSAVILALILLILFAEGQKIRGGGKKNMKGKILGLGVLGVLSLAAAAFYMITLSDLDMVMEQCETNAAVLSEAIRKNEKAAAAIKEFCETDKVSNLKAIREYMENNEREVLSESAGNHVYTYYGKDENGETVPLKDSMGNPLRSIARQYTLESYAEIERYKEVCIMNRDGRTISSSTDRWYYDLNEKTGRHDEAYRRVLERKAAYFYEIEIVDNLFCEYTAVPIDLYCGKDENGKTVYYSKEEYQNDQTGKIGLEYGLMVAEAETELKGLKIDSRSMNTSSLDALAASENVELAILDRGEGHAVLNCSAGIGVPDISQIGLSEEEYHGNQYRLVRSGGEKVFIGVNELSGEFSDDRSMVLLTIVPRKVVFVGRARLTLTAGILGLISVLAVVIWFICTEKETKPVAEEQKYSLSGVSGPLSVEKVLPDYSTLSGRVKLIESVMEYVCMTGILVFLLFNYLYPDGNRLFSYILSAGWKRGFHIFSGTLSLYLLLLVTLSIFLCKKLIYVLSPMMNPNVETITCLIFSVAQYAGVLGILFYSMYLFGVQTGTVITSAGIVTIIFGLGANSLIGDLLAGMFIIMEREYKVGDIVTVEGFTGIVKQISLRTTKIQSPGGEVKTVNNSRIVSVLNLTDNYSTVFITLSIPLDVEMGRMEELVNGEFRNRMKQNRDIVEGPWFSGIVDVRGGYYQASIGTRCLQQRQWKVKKDLYKGLVALLQEKEIRFS